MRRAVAERAAGLVEAGMVVGLGTGRTAALVVEAIGRRVSAGLAIVAVATSERTADQARALHIRLVELDEVARLDLCIDGADEVDPRLDLVKGLGGALLREKLVACAADRLVIVVDDEKRVARLGDKAPLPVEVVPFGWRHTQQRLRALGLDPVLRERDGRPLLTDGGHYLLDCGMRAVLDARALGIAVKATVGVVEHGLFLRMASQVFVGTESEVLELRAS